MPDPRTGADLATLLKELLARPVRSREDLEAWYQATGAIKEALADPTLATLISASSWSRLWHYLSDADIRYKDPEYAALQNTFLGELIADLQEKIQ